MLRFRSKPISEHAEVPLADEGRWEELVQHWTERGEAPRLAPATPQGGNDVYVASLGDDREPLARGAQLAEILSLVRSQGDRIVGHEIAHVTHPNPRTLLGRGAAEQLASRARTVGATMLVVDAELTPSQARNLEDMAGIPICDREAVILNVLLRHAKTRRARIQVEIAQLEYLRPRIRGVGLDMDQQAGGLARGRGPGETASELLARKLDGRLEELEKALRRVETSSATQRRGRSTCRRIVLVGYTNAGKTSLMNALTAAGLSARDRPFETLDTTSRCLSRHGGDVVLSDTVGFIRRLPERLLASFASTFAEAAEASLLAIVVDASDPERALHLRTTRELLTRVGAQHVPRLYVFNKVDRLDLAPRPEELDRWTEGHPWVLVSRHDPVAVAALEEALLARARAHQDEDHLSAFVPYAAGALLALVYGKCRVLDSEAGPVGLRMRIAGPRRVIEQIRKDLKEVGR